MYRLKLQYFGDYCLFLGGVCVCIGLFWYPSETWCHRKNSRIHYLRTSGLWQEINSNWLKLKKTLVSKLKIPVVATLIMTGSKSLNATSEPISLHMSALLSSPLTLLLCFYGDWRKLSLTSSSLLAVLEGKKKQTPPKVSFLVAQENSCNFFDYSKRVINQSQPDHNTNCPIWVMSSPLTLGLR